MIQEYKVTLTSGNKDASSCYSMFLLAEDTEQAAWSALELAKERNEQLVNVQLTDAW